ncbi:hypothetical protein PQR14_03505 [Paraburkholderia bryophila]|uniref:hypothetical protein n=1 Tax=Burkholderiaceae TaxID=119060 RepID=UPI0012E03B00|nr:hypothetical protein [Burkholderia sp. 9120]
MNRRDRDFTPRASRVARGQQRDLVAHAKTAPLFERFLAKLSVPAIKQNTVGAQNPNRTRDIRADRRHSPSSNISSKNTVARATPSIRFLSSAIP